MNNLQCSTAPPCCANKHFLPFSFFVFLLLTLLSLVPSGLIAQQPRQVIGTVSDDAGERLSGVTVGVKNSSNSTQTDSLGRFQLTVGSNDKTLVFTYVGKKRREMSIASSRQYNAVLESDSKTLEEVIVSTGYMTQRKADLTGAITVINRSDFVKTPSSNVMRSLQGKVPGVMITTDGNPAENVGVRVRGITSLNSSDALIVLDGQPVTINLRDINPNDIESIQILKDAASASIYGSRAAGGVILVNTRKGRRGETRVTYEGYVGASKITGVPDMLSGEEYGRQIWQATVNDGNDPSAAIQIYNYDWGFDRNGIAVLNGITPREWLNESKTMPSANTNWFDKGTRTGLQQNHQLTIMGGGERLTSLFSLNYYNNEGTQITSFFKRIAARFNNDYQLVKGKVSIGENLTITNLKMRDVNSTYAFLVMPPNIPVYANDGEWGGVAMNLNMDDFGNPIRDLELNKDNKPNFLKVLGTAYLEAKILNNLSFKSQFGIDYSMWYERNIQRKWTEAGGKFNEINGVTQVNWHNVGQTWTNTLTYNLKFGQNNFDILAGIENYKFQNEEVRIYKDGLEIEDREYAFPSTASGERNQFGGGGDARTLLSYFGKVNYSFAGKYLLSATIRRDGASVFGENNRFGTFPAFSAGWRISDESFMKHVDFITDLKFRASYGQNGNSAPLVAGKLVNVYAVDVNGTSYPINGNSTGSIPSGFARRSIGNPNLKWETTTQLNFGMDFGLFDNKLTGSFDWFNKKTNDMLFEPPYIGALGEGGFRWVNAADMSNKGFELVLSYGNTKGKFTYRFTTNLSMYENKIQDLPENVKYSYGGNGLLDNVLGRPLNSMYGFVADGIFQNQDEVDNSAEQPGKSVGRIRYKDLDGDGVINDIFDRTWIGVSDPDLMAGLNMEFRYGAFDATIFVQGLFGNDVNTYGWKELSDFWNIGVQNDRNHPKRILSAWTPSNPNTTIPMLSRRDANNEKRFSSYYVENGSYVKVRTIDIGFNFPQRLIDRWEMSRLRVYVSGQNLINFKKNWGSDQFTAGDPENPGTGYPLPMTAIFGVNVTF